MVKFSNITFFRSVSEISAPVNGMKGTKFALSFILAFGHTNSYLALSLEITKPRMLCFSRGHIIHSPAIHIADSLQGGFFRKTAIQRLKTKSRFFSFIEPFHSLRMAKPSTHCFKHLKAMEVIGQASCLGSDSDSRRVDQLTSGTIKFISNHLKDIVIGVFVFLNIVISRAIFVFLIADKHYLRKAMHSGFFKCLAALHFFTVALVSTATTASIMAHSASPISATQPFLGTSSPNVAAQRNRNTIAYSLAACAVASAGAAAVRLLLSYRCNYLCSRFRRPHRADDHVVNIALVLADPPSGSSFLCAEPAKKTQRSRPELPQESLRI